MYHKSYYATILAKAVTIKEHTMKYLQVIIPMIMWGSVGVFVKGIPLTSSQIVTIRAIVGSLMLLTIYIFGKKKIDIKAVKKYLPYLLFSGGAMGFNWLMLYESYKYTSVSIATLTYYCAPAIIVIASPFVLKEKLTVTKVVGIATAMVGMLLVNATGAVGQTSFKGVAFGLGAAVLYACVTMINKKIKGLTGFELALVQLVIAALIITPYTMLTFKGEWVLPDTKALTLLAILCIFHTGVAFVMYFSATQKLPAQTMAACSFVDPVVALILSAMLLGDKLTGMQIIGAVVIIGGAMFAELYNGKVKEKIKQ